MFKRVKKLVSKQNRDEELGLTREVKADLGLETAFDESDSDSNSSGDDSEDEDDDDSEADSDSDDQDNESSQDESEDDMEEKENKPTSKAKAKEKGKLKSENGQISNGEKGTKRKRNNQDSEVGSDQELDQDGEQEDEDEEMDDDEEEIDPDQIPMTINQALENPITLSPVIMKGGSPISICLVCPQRELKNENMVKVHLDSNVS